ncbi:MAG: chemotaxis protein CheY [Parcubacteria group bacterium GW2011_GWA2_43_17]|nr:MAG: chemotaxis protein CheY [Parcubacteria group bacterium GW2011_GWA2_43_17]
MLKRLLIVDDEEGIVEEIADFFKDEGFEVQSAHTGEEAIQSIRTQLPHLIMIDLKLPDMSGLLVLKVAKELNPRIKAIVNTGYVDQNMVRFTLSRNRRKQISWTIIFPIPACELYRLSFVKIAP